MYHDYHEDKKYNCRILLLPDLRILHVHESTHKRLGSKDHRGIEVDNDDTGYKG